MEKSGLNKTVLFLIAIAGAVTLFLLLNSGHRNSPGPQAAISTNSAPVTSTVNPGRPIVHSQPAPEQSPEANEDNAASPFTLSREKIEEFLAAHHRDAASLLAAFHAASVRTNEDLMDPLSDRGYLLEAATNFPNDPRVQVAVLGQDAFPEDRRKWLDAFKDSSPSNAFANYLSARDYFQDNQTNAAVAELLNASRKSQFEDYQIDSFLTQEQMYLAGGKTGLEAFQAAMAGVANDDLPELHNMKTISQSIAALQKQYASDGDTESSQNLTQMGLGLSDRLTSGNGGKLIINQLVGMAVESTMLAGLDQNTSYDFLNGETPAQRSAELKQQHAEIRDLTRDSGMMILTMSESDQAAMFERVKIYGELDALRWLRQQHPATASPGK